MTPRQTWIVGALLLALIGCVNRGPELGQVRCSDGVDNDGDGLRDCADSDCDAEPRCATGAEDCFDGVDNDGDDDIDCDDSDCDNSNNCEVGADECEDELDNDNDGLRDCADSSCFSSKCFEICDDGRDNNVGGGTDCNDADCATSAACDEFEDCSDLNDNDGNGQIDCNDPSCESILNCQPNAAQNLGDPCAKNSDCPRVGGSGPLCLPEEEGFPQGYCSAFCEASNSQSCGAGGICVGESDLSGLIDIPNNFGICAALTQAGACRVGYQEATIKGATVCLPD